MPGALHDIDFMVKDSKRFADSGGWGYGVFDYDTASDTFGPGTAAHTATRKRCQVRVRLPHHCEGQRLRLHRLWEEVTAPRSTRSRP